jgi:transposase-like protein
MSAAKKVKAGTRKAKQRKRYSPSERKTILADALAGKLTGKQVAEKYGISALTYYLWRKKTAPGRRAAPGRNGAIANTAETKLRAAVRAKMTGLLAKILDEEVDRILGG